VLAVDFFIVDTVLLK
jgi:putative transposase